jgi:hypothetical protein
MADWLVKVINKSDLSTCTTAMADEAIHLASQLMKSK